MCLRLKPTLLCKRVLMAHSRDVTMIWGARGAGASPQKGETLERAPRIPGRFMAGVWEGELHGLAFAGHRSRYNPL